MSIADVKDLFSTPGVSVALGAIAGITGAIVGTAGTYLAARHNNKTLVTLKAAEIESAEFKLIVEASLADWKALTDVAIQAANRSGNTLQITPPMVHILNYQQLFALLKDSPADDILIERIGSILNRSKKIAEALKNSNQQKTQST